MGRSLKREQVMTASALVGAHYAGLSPGHRRLADFILANPHQAALATLEEMAGAADVSVATANRLAAKLGLGGHPELKRLLRVELEQALRPVEDASSMVRHDSQARSSPWRAAIDDELRRIEGIRAVGGEASFAKAAALLAGARRVFIIGFGSQSFFAQFAAFNLASLRSNVDAIVDSGGAESAERKLLDAGPEDAVLFLSFARYSTPSFRIAERLAKARVPILCITDSEQSPVARKAKLVILVERKPGFILFGGGAGAVAAIEALLHGTAAAIGVEEVERRSARLTSALGDAIRAPDED